MANIISITVENFRSYKNRTEFSFEAIDSEAKCENYHEMQLRNGKKIKLLNSSVIYGANASGKSNVIIALYALESFVKYSKRYDPKYTITYEPYFFASSTRTAFISFEIKFIVDGIIYVYAFSYTKDAFIKEELREEDGNQLFFKDEEGITNFNSNIFPEWKNEKYLKNHLALSELSLNSNPLIQAIYGELSLISAIPLTDEYSIGNNIQEAAQLIHDEPNGIFAAMIKELVMTSDIGIFDVVIREMNEEDFRLPESMPESVKRRIIAENKYEINMLHPSDDGLIPMQMRYESAGTKTLFSAGIRVLKALQEGRLLAYDEMNISLHPMLFKRLVELFNNENTNPKHAQLLVTTHDATLLEDDLLRADQIWFVEKKEAVSDIYSAIDFDDVSIDQPFETWYRAGRLGARPCLKPFLQGIQTKHVNNANK